MCATCVPPVRLLLLPTAPTAYTVAQVLANPIELNSRLGTYTNFVNLLDLCGLALPATVRPDGVAVRHHAARACRYDALSPARPCVPRRHPSALGATGAPQPPLAPLPSAPRRGEIAIAVVGAHLPACRSTANCGARRDFLEDAHRARLPALRAGRTRPKPGPPACRVRTRRRDRAGNLGPPGRGLWPLRRRDPSAALDRHADPGGWPHGERLFGRSREALNDARDISTFGGWRAYMAQA